MLVFYDVDTQTDFFPGGNLAVPDADMIKENIRRLTMRALETDSYILGSMDAHLNDDSEFEIFPPHCIMGTEGYQKIVESLIPACEILPRDTKWEEIRLKDTTRQIMFEKATYDIWDYEFGNPLLERTVLENGIDTVIVYGVSTNICVAAAVKGFIERKIKVYLVTDAIKGLTIDENNNEETALRDMIALGAIPIETNLLYLGDN